MIYLYIDAFKWHFVPLLLLHRLNFISGLTKQIDHSVFSRQMTCTDHKEGGLLRKKFLHLFLPVEIADLDDGVIFITGHLLLKNLPKRVKVL